MAWKINYVNKEINHNQMTSHGFIDLRARIVSFASWLKVHDTEYFMRSAIFSALSFRRRRIWYWHTSAHTTTLHPTKTTYNRHISMSKYFSNEKPSHSRSMFTNFGRRWQFFLFFGMKFSMTFFLLRPRHVRKKSTNWSLKAAKKLHSATGLQYCRWRCRLPYGVARCYVFISSQRMPTVPLRAKISFI